MLLGRVPGQPSNAPGGRLGTPRLSVRSRPAATPLLAKPELRGQSDFEGLHVRGPPALQPRCRSWRTVVSRDQKEG